MREELTKRALSSAFTREKVNISDFYNAGRHRQFARMVIGNSSATDMVKKHKYIDESTWPVTDSELARQYLNVIWEQREDQSRQRVGFSKKSLKYLDINPPAWFPGPTRGELAYVDIKSCYFQLYQPLTLDLNFSHSPTYFGLGSIPWVNPSWLRSEKAIRNSIVGICRSRERQVWENGVFKEEFNRNRFLAPELWGYMMLTLHHVAHEIVRNFRVYYWNTDGCIVPLTIAGEVMSYLSTEWGLESSVRARGLGEVFGFGSYRVGDSRTATVHRSDVSNHVCPGEYVYTPDFAAKLKRWRFWALNRQVNSDTS